ncbi:MAG: hypothetical protein AAFZ52_09410 [Bacteroidota bacterium]
MLKQFSYLLAMALVLVMVGCADEEAAPIIVFDELEIGAFPRFQSLTSGEFDLNNTGSSIYEMDIDFVDGNGGTDVAQYNVYARFDGNNTDTDEVLVKSFAPSDFSANGETGNLGLTVQITFPEIAAASGVDINAIEAGELFRVRTEVVKSDGKVFSSANSTPAVSNAFGGIWNFNVTATCPLNEGTFLGDYRLTYKDGVYEPLASLFGQANCIAIGADPLDVVVSLRAIPGSTTRREYDVTFFPTCGWARDVVAELDFVCTVINSSGPKTAVECEAGTGFGASQMGEAAFNFNDDSSFEITYRDLGPGDDAGCGPTFNLAPYTVVFTKI